MSSFHQHQSPPVMTNQRQYYLCASILFSSTISGMCHRSSSVIMYCHAPSSFRVLCLLLYASAISQRRSSLCNTSAPFSITPRPSLFAHHRQLRAFSRHQASSFIISHHRARSCIIVHHRSSLSVIIGHPSLSFIVTHHQPPSSFNIPHVSVSVVISRHRST